MNYQINLSDSVSIEESFGIDKKGIYPSKYRKSPKKSYVLGAKKFVEYAELDLLAAEVLFNIQDKPYDFMNQAAFLCAQSTEKYLKAVIFIILSSKYTQKNGLEIIKEIKKEYGHDLNKLFKDCKNNYPKLESLEAIIKSISKYSYLKYPDVEENLITSDSGLSIDSHMIADIQYIKIAVENILNNEED